MKKLLFAFVSACTGMSGVDTTVELVDASEEELDEECEYLSEKYPHKKLTCDGKSEVFGFGSKAACVADLTDANASHPECQMTIGDLDECMDYLYGMTCDTAGADAPDACKRLFSSSCN